ncbi:MAG: hypothetical protein HQK83_13700 [Fibrobacteria bacterium]|nr:hypothetical protein [Fibrobacteria bacterium]
MFLYILFGFCLVLLVVLTATAAYFALQKKDDDSENFPTIHQSGVFSIIRKSPREALEKKQLTLEQIKEALAATLSKQEVEDQAESYYKLWTEILEESISIIEDGDTKGLQTYMYNVPERDTDTCKLFSGNTYVTREQLQNFPNIIPPFHLGCNVRLISKEAWNTNLDGTGWKPLLPENGKYPTPEWRTIAKIES